MVRRIGIVVLSMALMGIVVLANGQASVGQTLFLTFVPNIQFAPVYVALEKGYFAEAGIDVTIEHGDEPLGVDLIAAGERQFGVIGGEQVVAARANGRPVTMVYQWFQQFPIALVTPENSGIATISDAAGRRVGVPGRFGATYSGLVALLTANGMTESEIDLQEIGFNAPEVICLGAVDAAAVYVNNEPLVLQNLIDQGDCGDVTGVSVFPVSEYANLVSNGLITNEATIAENPELVRAMVAAFDRGVRDVLNDPAEAYVISAGYVETLPLTDELRAALQALVPFSAESFGDVTLNDAYAAYRDGVRMELGSGFEAGELLQMNVLLNTSALWQSDDALGYTQAESWVTTAETLVTMGFLDEVPELQGAYTNDFLPE
jgi:NitT/TauT family transport system substrate-binding protein